jgi:hypothetical protein
MEREMSMKDSIIDVDFEVVPPDDTSQRSFPWWFNPVGLLFWACLLHCCSIIPIAGMLHRGELVMSSSLAWAFLPNVAALVFVVMAKRQLSYFLELCRARIRQAKRG